jgi:demethylmenaquinone methyltransferase/2-methoxy-6-polyprenyl-1,4-benzoquinol methylase
MNDQCTHYTFDPVAAKYDRCNHIFSLGVDHIWRKRLVGAIQPDPHQRVLDMCTGTGDVVYSFLKHSPVNSIMGVDLSQPMLDLAREKQVRYSAHKWMRNRKVSWKLAGAAETELDSGAFDIAVCAFGIRNISDREAALNEIHRLLKVKGKFGVLEFSLPTNPVLKFLYKIYLNHIMPWLGKYVVGYREPLDYLAKSIMHWHTKIDFSDELLRADFKLVRRTPLTGGIATLWLAVKD